MATTKIEQLNLEIDFVVVGCKYRDWDDEDFSNDEVAPMMLSLVPEPSNPHDPHAIKVLYKGQHCGYVRRDCTAGVSKFKEACEILRTYPHNYKNVIVSADLDSNGMVLAFVVLSQISGEFPTYEVGKVDAL